MGQLSKKEIESALNSPSWEHRLVITPLLGDEQIGASSVDLRLGHQFIVTKRANTAHVGATAEAPEKRVQERFFIEKRRQFFLHPNELVLGCSLEYIRVPKIISALVTARSSWGRAGLAIATATAVAPGYKGVITLELTNLGNIPIRLFPGLRIAQIMFYRLESPAEYAGKYDCLIGPEYPMISRDSDLKFWFPEES